METILRDVESPSLPEDLTVEFSGDVNWEDEGIGSYDYCGSYGNDVQIVPVCQKITWDKSEYTTVENEAIRVWLKNNSEDVYTALENQFGNNN